MKLNNLIQKKKISSSIKKSIAFKSLSEVPISHIAIKYNCCRNTVYKQQAVAKRAVNDAFDPKPDDVLFYIARAVPRKYKQDKKSQS